MNVDIAIKGVIVLGLFYAYYVFVLKSTTWHSAKRFYLLFATILLCLPFIPLQSQIPILQYKLPEFAVANTEKEHSLMMSWLSFALIYKTGLAVSALIFITKLVSIISLFNRSKRSQKGIRIIPEKYSPCSFLFWTFIPQNLEGNIRKQVLAHERAHIRCGHSIDILFFELLTITFWFNPLLYFLKKELKMVHEHQADKLAGQNQTEYAEKILEFAQWKSNFQLASAINPNFQQLKNRIEMLHKTPTKTLRKALFAGVLPLLMSSIIIVACSENADVKPTDMEEVEAVLEQAEVMPEFEGGMNALMTYLGNNVKYPEQEKIDKVEERIFVQFTVKADGAVADVNVLKGENKNLKAAAVKAIKGMPNWKPGMNEGKPVAVRYTLPVNFKIQ